MSNSFSEALPLERSSWLRIRLPECGKYVYGLLIGFIAVMVRVLNPGYPEGMMLAILLLNLFSSLIDYFFVQSNINMRAKRAKIK